MTSNWYLQFQSNTTVSPFYIRNAFLQQWETALLSPIYLLTCLILLHEAILPAVPVLSLALVHQLWRGDGEIQNFHFAHFSLFNITQIHSLPSVLLPLPNFKPLTSAIISGFAPEDLSCKQQSTWSFKTWLCLVFLSFKLSSLPTELSEALLRYHDLVPVRTSILMFASPSLVLSVEMNFRSCLHTPCSITIISAACPSCFPQFTLINPAQALCL